MDSLQHLHTFALPSKCRQIISVKSAAEVFEHIADFDAQRVWILGEGSNCIFVDDFDGTILHVDFKGIEVEQTNSHINLQVAAGENWHQLVQWCLHNQIYGFENLALIPGLVGAAPIQNIGAYGVEVATFIHSVEFIDLQQRRLKVLEKQACQFAYRDSIFKSALAGKCLITKVHFQLPKHWQPVTSYAELNQMQAPSARAIFDKVVEIRRRKLPDPKVSGNAGSFFKNPIILKTQYQTLLREYTDLPHYPVDERQVKIPAAWLIDRLGFKGKTFKGVACHQNQPLVLVNQGTASGAALLQFARNICSEVQEAFGIKLQNEVNLIGREGVIQL